MGDGKKYFMLNYDIIHIISHLPNEKAGELFKHILSFVHEQDPVSEDYVINMAFEPIKKALLKNYDISKKRSEAGKISGIVRNQKTNKVEQKTTKRNKVEQNTKVFNLDYQEIINVFNGTCVELPKANLTSERIKMIDKLLKTYSLEQIGQVFINTSESDYLNGKINNWKANLNWLLNPTNFVKVLEGNYANVKVPVGKTPSVEEQWNDAKAAVHKYFNHE
jgi:hypothetical protein